MWEEINANGTALRGGPFNGTGASRRSIGSQGPSCLLSLLPPFRVLFDQTEATQFVIRNLQPFNVLHCSLEFLFKGHLVGNFSVDCALCGIAGNVAEPGAHDPGADDPQWSYT